MIRGNLGFGSAPPNVTEKSLRRHSWKAAVSSGGWWWHQQAEYHQTEVKDKQDFLETGGVSEMKTTLSYEYVSVTHGFSTKISVGYILRGMTWTHIQES